jgi:hypothetical protein
MYTKKSALQNPHLLLFINYITTVLQPPPQILRLFPKSGAVSLEPLKPNFMFKRMSLFAFIFTMVIVIPAAAQVPAYVPTDGLVGWWPFNGNANDESGNGNDGVVNGATLAEDRFGNIGFAFEFNGAGSNIVVSNSSSLNPTELSLSVWIYPLGDNLCVMKKSNVTNAAEYGYGITHNDFFFFQRGLKTQFGFTDCTAVNDEDAFWSEYGIVPNNAWTMLSVTIDGNGLIRQFINGALVLTQQAQPLFSCNSANSTLRFGGQHWDNDPEWFEGIIDDIAIYNRALSEQEIQNLYTGQCPAISSNCSSLPSNLQQGLVGYWPFCGNANDESGNGNDGVVNGATLSEDRFGNAAHAYNFNGLDNFIDLGSSSSLNSLDTNFTISAWINDFSTEGLSTIIACHAADVNWRYLLRSIGDSISSGFVRVDINNWADNHTSAGTIESNIWTNITIIRNDNLFQTFINGTLSSSIDVPLTPIGGYSENAITKIGVAWPSAPNFEYFQGLLDDIGIWNRALTPEEVQELYTLDACTFTVYDTLTVYETVYDTVYTYETIYDTVTTYVTVTDTLLIDITFTGFEGQPSWLNTVTVFPNPASDHITIDYGNFALMAGYNTIITDAAGATVYSSAVNSQQVDIDINAWGATGVYYMMIYDSNGVMVAVRQIVLE